MNKIELLAPAKDLEKAKTAVDYGADAVYVGGKSFSLRSRASNFTNEDIAEIVEYAHARICSLLRALAEEGVTVPKQADVDMALLNVLPVVVPLTIIVPVLLYLVSEMPLSPALYVLTVIATFWIGMSLSSLIAVIKSGHGVKDKIKGILMFPLFIITWVPIMLLCFFKRDVKWTPIKHDQNVTINDRENA